MCSSDLFPSHDTTNFLNKSTMLFTVTTKRNMANTTKFDPKSPGFIASITYVILAALAATGVEFPQDAQALAGDFETTLNTGGILAVTGLLVSSIVFPVWNFKKRGGKISGKTIISNTTFWVSAVTALLASAVLFGFTN